MKIVMSINNLEVNKNYECESDKELIVATVNASDGGRASVEIVLLDDLDKETRLAGASVHFFGGSDTWVFMNSATAIVKRGQKYKIKYNVSSAPTTVEAYYLPF
jgi:hypothetical protein